MRKKLDRVTLVIVDCVKYGEAINSLQKSLKEVTPARTIFFTDADIELDMPEVEIIKIPTIESKQQYSYFIVKQLYQYINTDFVLVTQWDAWVLNGDSWDDEFYKYDVVSAPWLYVDGRNVGNGGFSLRSTRLQVILGKDGFIDIYHPEDEIIGRLYRYYLEAKYGIKFPTDDVADRFAFELRSPVYDTFGFHGFFHKPYQPVIMITRKGALGDVIALEPLLHYYYEKGYRVVLNTTESFYGFFNAHYFKIHHPKEMDGRLQYKEINLDMAYESFPKQLHLKSYYRVCAIPESEWDIRNPILTLSYDPKIVKLFNKYVVIHIDEREQASRNVTGIDWEEITSFLHTKGYDVIQVGLGKHEEIKNAIFMNTPTETILMSVVASADLFIGVDSGVSNIAIALDVKAVIFSGSVDLRHIIPDMSNVTWIHNHDKKVCELAFCWHENNQCEGTKCYIDDDNPPCNVFDTYEVIDKINEVL